MNDSKLDEAIEELVERTIVEGGVERRDVLYRLAYRIITKVLLEELGSDTLAA